MPFSKRPKRVDTYIHISDHGNLVIFILTPGTLWQNVVRYTFGRKITNHEVRYDNLSPVFYQYHKKFPGDSHDQEVYFFLGTIKSKKTCFRKKLILFFVTVHTPFCFGRDDMIFASSDQDYDRLQEWFS